MRVVEDLVSLADLDYDFPYFLFRKESHLVDEGLEGSLVAILHYYVEVVFALYVSLHAVH